MVAIERFRNKYEGERIFLVGNGPSLNDTPMELLADEFTFGCNGIPEIFDQTEWRPSFYACVDGVLDEKYYQQVIDEGIPCFIADYLIDDQVRSRNNVYPFNHVDLRDSEDVDAGTFEVDYDTINSHEDVWSSDISEKVYGYNTVLHNMMQISQYMGFDEIYLIGADMYDVVDEYFVFPEASDFATFEGTHDSTVANLKQFLGESEYPVQSFVNAAGFKLVNTYPSRRVYSLLKRIDKSLGQSNYFSKDYGTNWIYTREVNVRLEVVHELIDSISDEVGIDIRNATIGGHLEVYPRVDLFELLSDPR